MSELWKEQVIAGGVGIIGPSGPTPEQTIIHNQFILAAKLDELLRRIPENPLLAADGCCVVTSFKATPRIPAHD